MHNADWRPPVATRSFHKWILCAPCAIPDRRRILSSITELLLPLAFRPEITLSLVYGHKKLD